MDGMFDIYFAIVGGESNLKWGSQRQLYWKFSASAHLRDWLHMFSQHGSIFVWKRVKATGS